MCVGSERHKMDRYGHASTEGREIPRSFRITQPSPYKIESSPRRRRRSGVSRRRADWPGARARARTGWRLGPGEGHEPRLSTELASVVRHRGPVSRPARRRRRGRHSRGRADGPRARARPGTGGRLRTGEADDGWLAADEQADSNCVGVDGVAPGGFLRSMDRVLGFEAIDSLENPGARRTKGSAVHPHRGQFLLFKIRSKCLIFWLV